MPALVVCSERADNGGRTCRQRWRERAEFWCDECGHRLDHEHGKHAERVEGCPLCVLRLEDKPASRRRSADGRFQPGRFQRGARVPGGRVELTVSGHDQGPLDPVPEKRARTDWHANGDLRSRMPCDRSGGDWPAQRGGDPKPPAILALYEDIAEEFLPRAIFGQYPQGLISKVLPWLRCRRDEVLHVCSGCLPPGEGTRVDVRPDARPDVIADGRALPFADSSFAAVMLDPPYTEQYARDLYGTDYPLPAHLLREAARVVRPCGRIAFVHYLVPMPPEGTFHVKVLGCSTGFGFPMRAVTIYEKEQDGLFQGGI